MWTRGVDRLISIPIAHGEGRYVCDDETLKSLQDSDQIAFVYANENPNGSVANIAGIVNKRGNVLGMMPHPEKACEKLIGGDDGNVIFTSMIDNFARTLA